MESGRTQNTQIVLFRSALGMRKYFMNSGLLDIAVVLLQCKKVDFANQTIHVLSCLFVILVSLISITGNLLKMFTYYYKLVATKMVSPSKNQGVESRGK